MLMRDSFDGQERALLVSTLVNEGPAALDRWLDELVPQPTDECVRAELVNLHVTHNLFALLATVRDADVRPALNLVLEAASQIQNVSVSDVLNLYRFAKELEDAFLFYIEEALAKLLRAAPQLNRPVLDALKAEGMVDGRIALLWSSAFCGSLPDESFEFLTDTPCDSDSELLLRIAVFVSVPLPVRHASIAYESVVVSLVPDILEASRKYPGFYFIWRAVCLAAELASLAASELKAIALSENFVARNALMSWIAEKAGTSEFPSAISVSELMLPVFNGCLLDSEACQLFDATLARLLRRKETSAEALRILTALAMGKDSLAMLRLAMHAVSSERELFSQFFAICMASKEVNSKFLRSMIRKFVTEESPCKIDGAVFSAVDYQGKKRIGMRLLAWTHNAPCLMAFAEDFAEDPNKQPTGVSLADLLLVHLISEYPVTLANWLESKVKSISEDSKDAPFAQMYRHHHARAEPFRAALNELPTLSELSPTSPQQLALQQRRVRSQREVNKAANAQSVFSQIAKRVTILQGKQVATVMPNGNLEISNMAEFSYSIELPMSERADPVGALMKRIDYLHNAE
jgi:hypothetical protein